MKRARLVSIFLVVAFLFLVILGSRPENSQKPEPKFALRKAISEKTISISSASIKRESPLVGQTRLSHASPKFQLSAKEIEEARVEIKISLASIYGGQKAFFAEYGRYTSDIYKGIGYIPEPGMRWSKVGFLSPYQPREPIQIEDPNYLDTDAYLADRDLPADQRFSYHPSAEAIDLRGLASLCAKGCEVGEEGFEIIAAVALRDGGPPDVWTINEKKEIRHLQDGTTLADVITPPESPSHQ